MSDSQTCVICSVGCDTVNKSSDGVCPKYWQRPAGSLVCSQAWNCMPYRNINERIVGSFFFVVALIYIRIIYYNYTKNPIDAERSAPHQSSSTCTSALKKISSPQNFARCIR